MNTDQHALHPLTWFLLSLLKSSEICSPHINHHQSSSIYLILFLLSIVFHFWTERREKSAVSSLGYSCQWLAIASTCVAEGPLKPDIRTWHRSPQGKGDGFWVEEPFHTEVYQMHIPVLLLLDTVSVCSWNQASWHAKVCEYSLQCIGFPLQK